MFLPRRSGARFLRRFPHSRGDVPALRRRSRILCAFSPLTWGCSGHGIYLDREFCVFPTHVGMFRRQKREANCLVSFPHSRGDVPNRKSRSARRRRFSPLTWGCSVERFRGAVPNVVFPTHVGMFRGCVCKKNGGLSFPHSRGDVPLRGFRTDAPASFSPLTWGCSAWRGQRGEGQRVFPTHVGMFRTTWTGTRGTSRFPHSRGDVPSAEARYGRRRSFSPLTWGCSAVR